jgi:hypothetical protein
MSHDADRDSPPPDEPPPQPVSDVFRDFMGQDSIQDLILRVVRKRIFFNAPQSLVDEIVSDANIACLEAKTKPADMEKGPAWVAGVTVNVVRLHFRRCAKDQRWIHRDADVDEVALEEIAPPVFEAVDDASLFDSIDTWLDKVVARSARDQETLKILRHKARTKQTDAQVVEHFGLSSVSALSSRVHYFKTKYEDRRRRWLAQRERTIALWFKIGMGVAAAIVLAAIAWWFWQSGHPERRFPAIPGSEAPFGRGDGLPVSHPRPPDDAKRDGGGD